MAALPTPAPPEPTDFTSLSKPRKIITVPLDRLVTGHTPRLDGEDEEHIRALADTDADLPPILVQRNGMRVIDGTHRLHAARLRGDATISVRFLDCTEAMAFVRAVEANITHGLPLTIADRLAAARRIIQMFPQWSDRSLAAVAGLSPKTVASIRTRKGDPTAEVSRIGKDGRVRPINKAEGRHRATQFIAEHPDASLRQIARAAGISPTTARDVRDRLRAGANPVPNGSAGRGSGEPMSTTPERGRRSRREAAGQDRDWVIDNLRRDPSLRYNEIGRSLLRWLELRVVAAREWEPYVGKIPSHCSFILAELAHACAAEWNELAIRLEQRTASP